MAVAAPVIMYRRQYVHTFEQKVAMLRHTATRELMSEGQQARFLVAGSGGATAVTRGTDGDIPYGASSNTQVTATLTEKHGAFEITGFNAFASQGPQLEIMRTNSMAVINRDIDLTFLAILDTGTQDANSTAQTADLNLITTAKAILGQADVDIENPDEMFAAITPGFRKYLEETTEFTNGDYVDFKPHANVTRKVWRWSGVNWIVSNRITGVGTTAEKCYMWSKNAIGYAANVGEDRVYAGFDEKQGKSWTRAEIYHGGVVLQDTGIVRMNHDGSAISAS